MQPAGNTRGTFFLIFTPVPSPSLFLDRPVELLPVRKRRRATEPRPKIHTKNVVCLPPMSGPNCTIPWGETHAKLVESGFVAKMSFESTWDEMRIDAEIYGLFHHLFESEGCNEIFSFQYLR